MTSKTQEEAADKRTLAERQRDARATPERACGPDPLEDFSLKLTREQWNSLAKVREAAQKKALAAKTSAR